MIGSITSDYNTGLKVLERINELKIVKHSEKISHIYGYHQVIFMYSDENTRDKHESDMILRGWSKMEAQNYVSIYSNLYEERYLKVLCSVYEKDISAISLVQEG
ncbi:MAG: hypothetical protein E7C49_11770 [Clostridium sp.]|nr:hypothetical protein [Clostridium sp.]